MIPGEHGSLQAYLPRSTNPYVPPVVAVPSTARSRSHPGTGTVARVARFTQTLTSSPRAIASPARVKVWRLRKDVLPTSQISVR